MIRRTVYKPNILVIMNLCREINGCIDNFVSFQTAANSTIILIKTELLTVTKTKILHETPVSPSLF